MTKILLLSLYENFKSSKNLLVVYNVIPDKVTIKGTIRTYKSSVRSTIKRELKNTVIQTARSTGAKASLKYIPGYPVVNNNKEVVRTGVKVAKEIFGSGKVKELKPSMGGEDFSYYLKQVPGAMFFLGGSKGKKHTVHHNAGFDIDESALIKGVEFLCRLSWGYLS